MAFPSSPITAYAPVPLTPTGESSSTRDDDVSVSPHSKSQHSMSVTTSFPATATTTRRRIMMLGAIGILSILVLLQTYSYTTHGVLRASNGSSTKLTRAQLSPPLSAAAPDSWMDKIVYHRSSLANASHELKAMAHDRKNKKDGPTTSRKKPNGSKTDSREEYMVDLSALYEVVVEAVRDVGVRGLLFEVLSDDFEYYVYGEESASSDQYSDDVSYDESMDELDAYWENCAGHHGVGCNTWDVWWTYHYIGAILTDRLLEDHEVLWDGSSGETIRVAGSKSSSQSNNENYSAALDSAMQELLGQIHRLQARMPYVTQASFHAQHALIWRYAERSKERQLFATYPWELALNFCRGDFSIPKGLVGRPVSKGIDHECFHGFGHAVFYAVASKQLEKSRVGDSHPSNENSSSSASRWFLRPHGGFELTPESYCEVHALCLGASPSEEERRIMDPTNEASGNSFRICFEGVVHSVRLLAEDAPEWRDKETAIEVVEGEMKRCARQAKRNKNN